MAEVGRLKEAVGEIRLSDELKRYIVDLAGGTRKLPSVQLGASPRGSLALMKTSQALALFDGEAYVTPDHVQEAAVDVLAHRLVLDPQAQFSGGSPRLVVEEVLANTPVPA
jgi:MoxR-like ATPase